MTIIVCKAHRKGGTKIDIADKVYHFKPASGDGLDPDVPHTCDIPDTDAAALYRLLSIKEGYCLADEDAKLPPKPKADPGQVMGNEKPVDKEKTPDVIITSGDQSINLSQLAPEDLRILARDTFGISVHHKWADQTVIMKIVEKTRGTD